MVRRKSDGFKLDIYNITQIQDL